MYAVVVGIGIPAAFRNLTALAMVITWLAVESIYQATGNSLPLRYSFMADVTIIGTIYAKTIRRIGPKTYRSTRQQLECLITELNSWDRCIIAIFLLGVWPLYVLAIDPWWKWMALWALTIIQYLFAGSEAFACFKAEHKKDTPDPATTRHMVVIPFPARVADAVREPLEQSDLLIVKARGHG